MSIEEEEIVNENIKFDENNTKIPIQNYNYPQLKASRNKLKETK